MRWVVPAGLLALAILFWLVFGRRGSVQAALGTVLTKGQVAAGTYIQYPIGTDRGFRTPNPIPIAESNVFELKIDGVPRPVRASFNLVKGRQFEAGQRVRVQYSLRGLPPFWSRISVVDMTPWEGE